MEISKVLDGVLYGLVGILLVFILVPVLIGVTSNSTLQSWLAQAPSYSYVAFAQSGPNSIADLTITNGLTIGGSGQLNLGNQTESRVAAIANSPSLFSLSNAISGDATVKERVKWTLNSNGILSLSNLSPTDDTWHNALWLQTIPWSRGQLAEGLHLGSYVVSHTNDNADFSINMEFMRGGTPASPEPSDTFGWLWYQNSSHEWGLGSENDSLGPVAFSVLTSASSSPGSEDYPNLTKRRFTISGGGDYETATFTNTAVSIWASPTSTTPFLTVLSSVGNRLLYADRPGAGVVNLATDNGNNLRISPNGSGLFQVDGNMQFVGANTISTLNNQNLTFNTGSGNITLSSSAIWLQLVDAGNNRSHFGLSGTTSVWSADNATDLQVGNVFKVTSGGDVVLNASGVEAATSTTAGFAYLPTINGAASGTPAGVTGAVACVYDRADNRQYCYSGGAWHYVQFS